MIFRKNKIKETKKRGLYGNRYNSSNHSSWDNLSIVEKFCIITMPCALCFMIYTMLSMFIIIWWIRLTISIGIVAGLIGLIVLLVNFFTNDY